MYSEFVQHLREQADPKIPPNKHHKELLLVAANTIESLYNVAKYFYYGGKMEWPEAKEEDANA